MPDTKLQERDAKEGQTPVFQELDLVEELAHHAVCCSGRQHETLSNEK